MVATATTGELQDLLSAIYEALNVPSPATLAGEERRNLILVERAMYVTLTLRRVLHPEHQLPVSDDTASLRTCVAGVPATGYVPLQVARARSLAGESHDSSVRKDFPGYDPTEES